MVLSQKLHEAFKGTVERITAGGVGSLLCQWANAFGAIVIGTVSTNEKAAQAKEDGCHHVIMYKNEDFVSRVNGITSGKGVDRSSVLDKALHWPRGGRPGLLRWNNLGSMCRKLDLGGRRVR
ncbi:hypothetical protein AALP_AA4G221600 [Arabis alpina]|uniref:Alcohol dehydrogenase-like C-terminal domain-containing protein n=1 Tax=Arabis alpina TaxID=50452 RepID=A0A087H4W2_ARAAL|nr:hypothetical protein AALP_AA4G221600 [Arabis alpina]